MTEKEIQDGQTSLAIVNNIRDNLDCGLSVDKLTKDQCVFMLQVIQTLVNFKRD